MRGKANNTLERKIYFYKADMGGDDGGKPLPYDPAPAFHIIRNLPVVDGSSEWYEADADGDALCLWVDRLSPCLSVRFCRVRRNGLPRLEQTGQISDLLLHPEQGLLEAVHIVFFPDNIVGVEYNHFGPRTSRLGSYLHDKSNKAVPKATFRPVLRKDGTTQLDRFTDLRILRFTIQPAYVEVVARAEQSLGDAFGANRRVLETPDEVSVVLKSQKDESARVKFLDKMRDPVKHLMNNDRLHENASELSFHGKRADSGKVETIDLLKDQLISKKRIVRLNERSRALDPNSAFEAIEESYEQLRDQIKHAASVSP